MGRPKGGKNKHWSKEEKLRIVLRAINGYESTWDVSRSENISNGMLNGWLKKEMYIDFNQDDYDNVEDYINAIIEDNNNFRPAYALKYKTPIQYRTELGFK